MNHLRLDGSFASGETGASLRVPWSIEANAKILQKEMIASGMDPKQAKKIVKDMKKEAEDFARKNGCT